MSKTHFLMAISECLTASSSAVPCKALPGAAAWQVPQRQLVVQAVPIGQYLLNWPPHAPLAYMEEWEAQGWQCVHVWEDVWQRAPAVVLGRLRALLGHSKRLHGRATKAQRIEQPLLQAFLKEHHAHVALPTKYKYGLFLKEELVAVAAFGALRTLQSGLRSAELIRYCSQTATTVVGGLSKLVKAFIADRAPQHLMTYADRDWSVGKSYARIGFQRVATMPPQTFWVDPHTMERHYVLDPNAPEWLPVCNTGNHKYVYLST